MVLGAREFDGAAVSAVRMAYKSMPRGWVGVNARDASIFYCDDLITRLLSLPPRSSLNYRASIAVSRAHVVANKSAIRLSP